MSNKVFKDINGTKLVKGDLILITPIPNDGTEYIKAVYNYYNGDKLSYYPLNEFGVNTITEEATAVGVDYYSKREFLILKPVSNQVMKIMQRFLTQHEQDVADEIIGYIQYV